MRARRTNARGGWRFAARRAVRVALSGIAVLVCGALAIAFVLRDADWWSMRDRIEEIRVAVFGLYKTPECRRDASACDGKAGPLSPPAVGPDAEVKPGLRLHLEMHMLYDFFNTELFGGRLPGAVITLQRHPGAVGYFAFKRFRRADAFMDEIALNPQWFAKVTMLRLVSTLVHEMCHQEIAHFGTPSKNGYHSMEWVRCMLRVGLRPSTTGKPGGAMTGQRVTHYVVKGSPFYRRARAHPLVGDKPVSLSER